MKKKKRVVCSKGEEMIFDCQKRSLVECEACMNASCPQRIKAGMIVECALKSHKNCSQCLKDCAVKELLMEWGVLQKETT